jgi:hypothetical protein
VYDPEASAETLTFSVIVELAPAAIEFEVVQETGLRLHVQPLPKVLLPVKTLGNESVTVTSPVVAAEVLLVTVIAYCPVPPGAKLPLCDRAMLQLLEWETLPLAPPQPLSAPASQIAQKDKRASFRCIMRRLPFEKVPAKDLQLPGGKIVRQRCKKKLYA